MMELVLVASALSDGAWLDALLPAALRGSVLLLAAGAATLLLRRASAAARHLVWALAFAGLLALPVLPALLPALEVPLPRAAHALLHALETGTPELHEVEIPFTVEVDPNPQLDPDPDLDPEIALVSGAVHVAGGGFDPAHADAALEEELALEVHEGALALGWPLLLLAAWAAGAAVWLGALLLGVLRMRSEGARARWVVEGPLADMLERLRAEAGVRRPVLLLRGDASAMPVTWGVLRPRILLPAGAEAWPAERLRAVLLHELAHVRRGDWAVLLAVEAACALYWFNPLVWAAAARLRAEGEHACDDQVLRAGSRPSDYAAHLLEVARTLRAPRTAHAGAVAMARPAQIRGRLLAVLAEERPRSPVSRRFAVPVLLAASLAVALLAALSPVSRVEAAPAGGDQAEPSAEAARAAAHLDADHGLAALDGLAGTGGPLAALDTPAPGADTPSLSAVSERCPKTGGSSRHEEAGEEHREASWHNQRGCGGRLESRGGVSYNSDRTDVAGVARGGRFMIELYDAGDRRRAEILPAAGGVRRVFTVNGRAREWDAEARRWMAAALAEYFAAMTPPPDPPLPPSGPGGRGPAAASPEGASDGDRAAALVAALGSGDADTETLRRVLRESRSVRSEADRAGVLAAVATHSGGSQTILREVLAASRGIESSAERARLLLGLAAGSRLSADTRLELLRSLDGISSKGERARVLRDFVERFGIGNAAAQVAWFEAVERIGSGSAKRDLLLAAVGRPEMDLSRTQLVIRAAEDIGSSADRAAVLLALADRGLVADQVREDFLRAVRGMSSPLERERVLARVRARTAAAPAADTAAKAGAATTTLHWTDTGTGRSASLEARDAEVDERGTLRILPGGFVAIDESHGGFRQRVRVERGPDGRLRRSYSGASVEPARRLEWEAGLVARFADGKRRRW
jgi:beta-lactamase regulating signal transducer with metallopeptidase domain